MEHCNYYFNVNQIVVAECFVDDYKKFSYELNEHLIYNYETYYAGLQLYQYDYNKFTVVAVYYDICGLQEKMAEIEKYIAYQYEETFHGFVSRKKILDFQNNKRIFCRHC
ncbi:MAG: hypothetical protein IJA27_06140 [Lachnospiraceae bacterium]|nr:hypothetical protein [Lachnospiraceae bacterium]